MEMRAIGRAAEARMMSTAVATTSSMNVNPDDERANHRFDLPPAVPKNATFLPYSNARWRELQGDGLAGRGRRNATDREIRAPGCPRREGNCRDQTGVRRGRGGRRARPGRWP